MQYWQLCIAFTPKRAELLRIFLLNDNLTQTTVQFLKSPHKSSSFSRESISKLPGGCHYLFVMNHLRINMSETDLSHINMVADSVSSDMCQYSWVVRLSESSISTNIFQTLSITNRKSQRAHILRACSSDTMCHMSCVTCHLSDVFFNIYI